MLEFGQLQVVINDGVEMMLEMSEKAELAGMAFPGAELAGKINPGAELAGGRLAGGEMTVGSQPL